MRHTIKSIDELMELINGYDAVSFDIFDTLIMRKTLQPEDVFLIVERKLTDRGCHCDFVTNRRRAILENVIANPNIHQIYDQFAEFTGLSAAECQDILRLEIEIEKRVLITRKAIAGVLQRIHDLGKPVFLITDMYLPADIIKEILTDLGITQYDDLLVSCDNHSLKTESLFSIYRKKHAFSHYLHIGDNPLSDIDCAERNDIDTVYLPSALKTFMEYDSQDLFKQADTIDKRNMLGFMLAEIYNDPFMLPQKREWHIQDMTLLALAPVVFCMIAKLKGIVEKGNYDQVLFASRDGYVLKKLYDEIKEKGDTKGVYFYTSRRAVTNLCCEDEQQILWLANLPYACGKENILKSVFGLADAKYDPEIEFNANILYNEAEIIEMSRERRDNYRRYLANIGVDKGTYLFVDLVSSGTCQMYLEKLIEGELTGYYLCKLKTDERVKEDLKYVSLYEPVTVGDNTYSFYQLYYLFESVLTSGEPSLDCFDKNADPVFLPEPRSNEEIEQVESLQRSLIAYFRDMWYLSGGLREPDAIYVDKLIGFWRDIIKTCVLSVNLRDDWMGTDIVVDSIR